MMTLAVVVEVKRILVIVVVGEVLIVLLYICSECESCRFWLCS
jgi:hypothetical protein